MTFNREHNGFSTNPDQRYETLSTWAEKIGYLLEEPTLDEIKNT